MICDLLWSDGECNYYQSSNWPLYREHSSKCLLFDVWNKNSNDAESKTLHENSK